MERKRESVCMCVCVRKSVLCTCLQVCISHSRRLRREVSERFVKSHAKSQEVSPPHPPTPTYVHQDSQAVQLVGGVSSPSVTQRMESVCKIFNRAAHL